MNQIFSKAENCPFQAALENGFLEASVSECSEKVLAGGRIRTPEGTKPPDFADTFFG